METTRNNRLVTVLTRNVMETLSHEQIACAVDQLYEAMKVPDPQNPDLWTTEVDGRKLWGVLDRGAGGMGEDVFTVLFPEDY